MLTVGEFVFIADDNSYSVDHPEDSEEWNLVIKNVRKSHAGQFVCQVSTKEDRNITITLNVLGTSGNTNVFNKINESNFV